MKTTIVLVAPETSGNVGAVARAMANFESKKLILINPRCNHLNKTALDRASHAKSILKGAKVIKSNDLKKVEKQIRKFGNHIIGTTSKLANDYNILRSVENINDIAPRLSRKGSNIVILFGRESCGLTNEELEMSDFAVTIPTSKKYGVMNLSHAVTICLYEFYKTANSKEIKANLPKQAQKTEVAQLNKLINLSIDDMAFVRDGQDRTLRLTWKKLLSKLMLSRREAFALIGYFKKILKKR
jgi:TrmH family RNA methyltransferase